MCACAFPLLGIFDSVVTAAQTELENGRQRRVSASPSFLIIVSVGGPEGKSKGILDAEKKSGCGLWWLGSGRNLRATTEMTCFSISSGRINSFFFLTPGDVAERISMYIRVYHSYSGVSIAYLLSLVKA